MNHLIVHKPPDVSSKPTEKRGLVNNNSSIIPLYNKSGPRGAMVDLFLEQTKVFEKKLKDFHKKLKVLRKTQSYGGNLPQVAS